MRYKCEEREFSNIDELLNFIPRGSEKIIHIINDKEEPFLMVVISKNNEGKLKLENQINYTEKENTIEEQINAIKKTIENLNSESWKIIWSVEKHNGNNLNKNKEKLVGEKDGHLNEEEESDGMNARENLSTPHNKVIIPKLTFSEGQKPSKSEEEKIPTSKKKHPKGKKHKGEKAKNKKKNPTINTSSSSHKTLLPPPKKPLDKEELQLLCNRIFKQCPRGGKMHKKANKEIIRRAKENVAIRLGANAEDETTLKFRIEIKENTNLSYSIHEGNSTKYHQCVDPIIPGYNAIRTALDNHTVIAQGPQNQKEARAFIKEVIYNPNLNTRMVVAIGIPHTKETINDFIDYFTRSGKVDPYIIRPKNINKFSLEEIPIIIATLEFSDMETKQKKTIYFYNIQLPDNKDFDLFGREPKQIHAALDSLLIPLYQKTEDIKKQGQTIALHCSGGVGRSGMFSFFLRAVTGNGDAEIIHQLFVEARKKHPAYCNTDNQIIAAIYWAELLRYLLEMKAYCYQALDQNDFWSCHAELTSCPLRIEPEKKEKNNDETSKLKHLWGKGLTIFSPRGTNNSSSGDILSSRNRTNNPPSSDVFSGLMPSPRKGSKENK